MPAPNRYLLSVLFCALMPLAASQNKSIVMTGSAAKPSQPANLKVTPDLPRRLAKFRSVEMPLRGHGINC